MCNKFFQPLIKIVSIIAFLSISVMGSEPSNLDIVELKQTSCRWHLWCDESCWIKFQREHRIPQEALRTLIMTETFLQRKPFLQEKLETLGNVEMRMRAKYEWIKAKYEGNQVECNYALYFLGFMGGCMIISHFFGGEVALSE